MKKLILYIIIFLLLIGRLQATTYYVDCDNGNDGNSGTDKGLAWKTLTNVNYPQIPFNLNDTISFKCGTRFYGQCLIPPSNNLIFNSYDNGARPVIDGGGIGGNVCFEFSGNNISVNELKLVHGYPCNMILGGNHNTFESCNIDSSSGDEGTTSNPNNIYTDTGSYLTIRNSTMNYSSNGNGIYISGAAHVLLEYDIFQYNSHSGIRVADGAYAQGTDSLTIRYCESRFNGGYAHENDGMTNSNVYYNVFESSTTLNHDGAMYLWQREGGKAPTNCNYFNNTFITDSGSHGCAIQFGGSNGSTDYYQNVTGLVFKNNIFYNGANTYGLLFSNGNTQPTYWTFNNNLYYGLASMWHLNTDLDLTQWQSLGYDANSLQTDPLFINSDSGDFSLQGGSPASLAGVWVGLNSPYDHDILDTTIGNPPDIGAYQKSTYWQGQISSNKLMSGSAAIVDSLTVAAGSTLTISQGTHIKVENGSNIRVNGILQCNYDSQAGNTIIDTILSNNKKGEIIFDGSSASNSVIQNVTMKHLGGIQCLNGANILIENSEIDTCTQGIYIYNSGPQIISNYIIDPLQNAICGQAVTYMPKIKGNVISKTINNGWEGIFLINGIVPMIDNNDISGFDYVFI